MTREARRMQGWSRKMFYIVLARSEVCFVLLACLFEGILGQVIDRKEQFGKRIAERRAFCHSMLSQSQSNENIEAWRQKDCDFLSSRDEQGRELFPYQYKYLPYAGIVQRMQDLELMYPEYVSLYDAQGKYSMPVVGTCSEDTRGITKAGCKVWVLELGKRNTANAETRPKVFLSGALHGNERVGPTALVELATYMLGKYHQDAWIARMLEERTVVMMPAANAIGYYGNTREEAGLDPNRDFAYDTIKTSCMRTIAARAINEVWRQNIFTLAVTFHGGDNLLAFPWGDTFHCPGFPQQCQPKAVQGGSGNAVPFWMAPDHSAMAALALHASEFSGPQPEDGKLYRHGPLNDPRIIYPVGGGMEDWMYGASWGPRGVGCAPKEHGGYAMHKSVYANATHRAVNLLVEASDGKIPHETKLGHTSQVAARGGPVGHVARNVRLSLLVVDLAAPYVVVEGLYAEFSSQGARRWDGTQAVQAGDAIVVQWSVGGAFWLDEWVVECLPAAACAPQGPHAELRRAGRPDQRIAACGRGAPLAGAGCTVEAAGGDASARGGRLHACQLLHEAKLSTEAPGPSPRPGCLGPAESWGVCQEGKFLCEGVPAGWETTWAASAATGGVHAAGAGGREARGAAREGHAVSYLSTLTVREAVAGLAVRVRVIPDADWSRSDRVEGLARGAPQSHWVRARADPSWKHSVPGSRVEGRLWWLSPPVPLPQPPRRSAPGPPAPTPAPAAARTPPTTPPASPPAGVPTAQAAPVSSGAQRPPIEGGGGGVPPAWRAQALVKAAVAPGNASGEPKGSLTAGRLQGGHASEEQAAVWRREGGADALRQVRGMRVSWLMWVSPVVLLGLAFGLLCCCRRSKRQGRRGPKPS